MTIARRLLAAIAAACAAWPAVAAPLEAYGRLPSIEEIAISPDGERLAYTVTDGEQRRVVISSLTDPKSGMIINAADSKLRDLRWAGNGAVLITVSRTSILRGEVFAPRAEYFMVGAFNVETQKLKPLLNDNAGGLNIAYGAPMVRVEGGKGRVYLQGIRFVSGEGRVSLFRIDPATGASELISEGRRDTDDFLVDAEGQPVARTDYDRQSGRWTLRLRQGAGWRESATVVAPIEGPQLAGLGRDGRSVLVRQFKDGKGSLLEVGADGAWGEPFLSDFDGGLLRDPVSQRLIGVTTLEGDTANYRFFDPGDQRRWNAAAAAYPDSRVTLVSWSDDRSKLVVHVDSPVDGPGYALVDLVSRKGSWLGDVYEGLGPQDIGPVRPVRFKAADGLELSGYLTLPRGREAKNLPLVVHPHGGPASRDRPGFDWWAQAMASRGYAVLQVNFRGSEGFGWDFLKAGFGEWGGKMQSDLSDGVRHLAAEGVIDPRRVCIVGASYGGYAALAGAAFDTGVYRCAVSVAGPSHMRRMIAWSRERGGAPAQRYWTRFMGAEDLGDPVLAKISPAEHADRITAPVLLIHGRDDTVVPLEQSNLMAQALRKAGKPVELVVQSGADHWLSRGDTRLQMLQSIVTFLEKHNPPG